MPLLGTSPEPTPAPTGATDVYGNPDPEWLAIDWSEHLRSIRVRGTEVRYVELGPSPSSAGPPLVFVHGLSGAWQNWLEQIPHFAGDHRVVALDLPGFGGSPVPNWPITISEYGRFLGAFCDELGIERCTLVGHSMGGFIAAEVAISDPERAERLALVSSAGITHARMMRAPATSLARLAAATAPYAFKARERALTRPSLRHYALRGVFDQPNELRPELLWENIHAAFDAPGMLGAVAGLVGYDVTDRLPEIEVPTLVVWGRQDRVVPPSDGEEFVRLIPNAQRVVFDRCGHVPPIERPARFNALLETFLAS
ncbi:MAG: alpha/beta fold hydrolase [Solirubrobacterales bacterium]